MCFISEDLITVMDREIVLNWCVFAAICLISYSKGANSFPHGLDNSKIIRIISHSVKMMDQQAVVSELLKSKEKLELALESTRTRREVRANNGNHLTTSNLIPRGQYQPNENHHGSVVSYLGSDTVPKINLNLDSSRWTSVNDYGDFDGRSSIEMGLSDVSELGTDHGTPVKAPNQSIDFIETTTKEDLSVIPLKYNKL